MSDIINHFKKGNSQKILIVCGDLVNIILSHPNKIKNHLAWKIGKRMREGFDNGELDGNMGLVWQLIQCRIELDANKRFSIADLSIFLTMYDLFSDSFEDLAKISYGSTKVIVRFFMFRKDEKNRAVQFLSECIQNGYSEQKIKSLLES